MSIIQDNIDKRRPYTDLREDIVTKIRRANGAMSPKSQVEHEKRVRREIANSNERRRMQSINAGFENLRTMLPPTQEGEKLSKAAILQMAAKYIENLHNEINSLKSDLSQFQQILPGYTELIDVQQSPSSNRKRKTDDSRNFMINGRDSLTIHTTLDDDFMDVDNIQERLQSGHPMHIPDISSLRKPDYEQDVVEPESSLECRPIDSSRVITKSIIYPVSPRPESTNSVGRASNCLEHLVMAIEQIEGTQILAKEENDSLEPLRISRTTTFTSQSSVTKPTISPYTERIIRAASLASQQTSHSPIVSIVSSHSSANERQTSASQDYPIVSKLLNRPIPHKYLHRPQVVVNSSH